MHKSNLQASRVMVMTIVNNIDKLQTVPRAHENYLFPTYKHQLVK